MAIADLPLLQWSDFTHLGAFSYPTARDAAGDPSWAAGGGCHFYEIGGPVTGGGMAYNAANNSLFVTCSTTDGWGIAEIAIPNTLYTGNDHTLLPVASYIQHVRRVDPTMGRAKDVPSYGTLMSADAYLQSLALHNGRLIGTVAIYYDASNSGKRSCFYTDSLNLATMNCSPLCLIKVSQAVHTQGAVMQDLGDGDGLEIHHSGNTSGYLSWIPTEWRAELGNVPWFVGQTGQSIITRQSAGPNAHGFDPDLLSPTTYVRSKLYQQFNLGGLHWGYDTDDPWWISHYGSSNVAEWGGPPSDPATNKRKRLFSAGNTTGCFCPIPGTRTIIELNNGGRPTDWLLYGYLDPVTDIFQENSLPLGHPFSHHQITDSVDGRRGSGNYPVPRDPVDPWGTLPQSTYWERRIRLWDAQNFSTVYNGSSTNQDVARPYSITEYLPPVRRAFMTSYPGIGHAAVDPVNRRLYLASKYDNPVTAFNSAPVVNVYTWPASSPSGPTLTGNDTDRNKWARVT